MFRPTDPQISLLESQFLLPDRKLARLQKSWAEPFQKRILPLIDEDVLRDAFSEDNGRPNKSIRLLVGLHLLKEWNDLTDEQVKRYWGRFKVPVLALHSEKDEFVPEDIDQKWLNQRYKDASPMVSKLSGLIPNTGHTVENQEAREWLGEKVVQFLETLE